MNDVEKLLKIQNAVKQMIANGESTEYIDSFLESQGESSDSLKAINQFGADKVAQTRQAVQEVKENAPSNTLAESLVKKEALQAGLEGLALGVEEALQGATVGGYGWLNKKLGGSFADRLIANQQLAEESGLGAYNKIGKGSAELAGALISPINKLLPAGAESLGGKILQGGLSGAGYGALSKGFESDFDLGEIAQGATLGGALGAGIPVAVEGTKALAKNILGMTTGAGSRAIEKAGEAGQRGSKTFLQNMRGQVDEKEVVNYAKDYVKEMKKQAQNALVTEKGKIADEAIDIKPIKDVLDEVTSSLTYMNPEEMNVVKQANKFTKDFLLDKSRHTIGGADELKQAIGKISVGNYDSAAGALKTKMYNAIKNQITAANPQYSKIMEPFAQTAQTLDKVSKELSLNNKASTNIYTTLGKLQSALRNDAGTRYGARMGAVESLGNKASEKILDAVAGQSFATITPRGLTGRLLGGLTGGTAMLGNPANLATLPLFSPRVVGESVYKLGQLYNLAPSAKDTIIATTTLERLLNGRK